MPEKRRHHDTEPSDDSHITKKRPNRGFKVGPDNLPDGAYKRKNQKLKRNLIERARLKKSYAKVKRDAQDATETHQIPQPASTPLDEATEEPTINPDPHPDRQILIDQQAENPEEPGSVDDGEGQYQRRRRKPKTTPFRKEEEYARKWREEADERRLARENAEKERERRLEERERFRRAMAKARSGGPNGQRKLGRESQVLLEKVKRMVGAGG